MQELYYRELGSGSPLIILHGLFGSSDNWLTLGKKMAEKYKVYLVDQRNHGQSFHSDEFNYQVMSTDLNKFMQQKEIASAHILGHSMGGKTAMQFAVEYPGKINKLIVADIGPRFYPVHHDTILKGLFSINLDKLASRKEADETLSAFVPEVGVRQFLLKNLAREGSSFTWKMNLQVIAKEIEQVGKSLNQNAVFEKPTLFLSGGNSDYIKDADLNLIHSIFKNSMLKTIEGAGHWLHAEKPEEFFELTMNFLADE